MIRSSLGPVIPILRLSVVMGHRYDANDIWRVLVNDRKRKVVEKKPSTSKVPGPAPRRLPNLLDSQLDFSFKSNGSRETAFSIPSQRGKIFRLSLGDKFNLLFHPE